MSYELLVLWSNIKYKNPMASPEVLKNFKYLHKAGRTVELSRDGLKGTTVMSQAYSQIVTDR